jgi:type I restriction enzyme R subunit
VGSPEGISRAKEQSSGLGLFIRSLIGLDREAAKQASISFLTSGTITANQVEFINMIVDHLTQNG